MKGCYQAACQGHGITTWDIIQEWLFFFGPPAIIVLILDIIFIWVAKK
jgi:hypothetical protein